jgi:hypothetical protein
MALLERHAAHERGPAAADWLFVLVATLVVIAIAAIPFVIAAWAVGVIRQYL